MHALLALPAVQTFAIASSLLIILLYALGFLTAKRRNETRKVMNHEDVSINGGAEVVEVEHPDVLRVQRAHRNSIENAVPFFVVGLLFALTGPSPGLAAGLMYGFVALRVLHALFYLAALQPFRTASFAIGALINLAMAVLVLKALVGGGS